MCVSLFLCVCVCSVSIRYSGQPGVEATATAPQGLLTGMNQFLQQLSVTFRRDPTNFRPRINKFNSVKDREQKSAGNFFFMDNGEGESCTRACGTGKGRGRVWDGERSGARGWDVVGEGPSRFCVPYLLRFSFSCVGAITQTTRTTFRWTVGAPCCWRLCWCRRRCLMVVVAAVAVAGDGVHLQAAAIPAHQYCQLQSSRVVVGGQGVESTCFRGKSAD